MSQRMQMTADSATEPDQAADLRKLAPYDYYAMRLLAQVPAGSEGKEIDQVVKEVLEKNDGIRKTIQKDAIFLRIGVELMKDPERTKLAGLLTVEELGFLKGPGVFKLDVKEGMKRFDYDPERDRSDEAFLQKKFQI